MAWCTLLPKPLMMKTCSFSGTVWNTLPSSVVRLLEVVEVAGLRRLDDVEEDALVLLGRQLLLRGDVHDADRGHDAGQDEQRHRPMVERAVRGGADSAA